MSDPKLRFHYARNGVGAFFSHLDTMTAIVRALRRARIPYKITSGCHVRPRISFGPPLPLGHSSICEFLDLTLNEPMTTEQAENALRPKMPSGFSLLHVEDISTVSAPFPQECRVRYRLILSAGTHGVDDRIRAFFRDPEQAIVDTNPKGGKTLRLGPAETTVSETTLIPGDPDSHSQLILETTQGKPGVPSASKILTALIAHLGEDREHLLELERVALVPLLPTPDQ
jgi:radical SAM-linked protein